MLTHLYREWEGIIMAASDLKQYIIIFLDSVKYGINIKYIDNIIVMQDITRIPGAQVYFKGVINLRGEVIPVMSLKGRLGLPEDEYTSKARIIIVRPEPQAACVGLIVDEVKEVITLDASSIEKMNYDENDNKANYNAGIGKIENDLINLLNIPTITRT
jgi:purine-binding chemotaxis protein CheW